jgi:hypothetical protein
MRLEPLSFFDEDEDRSGAAMPAAMPVFPVRRLQCLSFLSAGCNACLSCPQCMSLYARMLGRRGDEEDGPMP